MIRIKIKEKIAFNDIEELHKDFSNLGVKCSKKLVKAVPR